MCCNRFKILKKTHIATYDRPATRLSASTIITSKKPDTISSKIFQVQISVYGLPEKSLSDNSGEFANDHFTNMCEAMNINFKLTSAE